MKKLLYLFLLAIMGMACYSCNEDGTVDEDLLKSVAEGKMVVVIGSAPQQTLSCTFNKYDGETFINGNSETTTNNFSFSIMYGDYNNPVAFTARTYSTAVEADLINVFGMLHGSATMEQYSVDNTKGAVMTIKVTEVTDNAIKGEFTGKMVKDETGLVDVKGAFWAVKGQMQ